MLGHVFYTATHFGFVTICFFKERKKSAVSCLYRTNDRTGHCKFRLDCRTKMKAKDGPLALLVQIKSVCYQSLFHLKTYRQRRLGQR